MLKCKLWPSINLIHININKWKEPMVLMCFSWFCIAFVVLGKVVQIFNLHGLKSHNIKNNNWCICISRYLEKSFMDDSFSTNKFSVPVFFIPYMGKWNPENQVTVCTCVCLSKCLCSVCVGRVVLQYGEKQMYGRVWSI